MCGGRRLRACPWRRGPGMPRASPTEHQGWDCRRRRTWRAGIIRELSTLPKSSAPHTIRFGSDIRQQVFTSMGPGYTSGNFVFDNTYTRRNDDTAVAPAGNLGLSWAAFMLGIPTTSSVDANDSYATSNPYYSGYIQDSWRVTPKLTVNFGLRFEYEAGMTERYNRMLVGWDPELDFADLRRRAGCLCGRALIPTSGQRLPGSGRVAIREQSRARSRGVARPGHASAPRRCGLPDQPENRDSGRLRDLLRHVERL